VLAKSLELEKRMVEGVDRQRRDVLKKCAVSSRTSAAPFTSARLELELEVSADAPSAASVGGTVVRAPGGSWRRVLVLCETTPSLAPAAAAGALAGAVVRLHLEPYNASSARAHQ
jgi:hypothetical protein